MTTGMTRRGFALATAGVLFVTGAICTTAVADDVKRVSANGTELSYVEAGQGEPVIFVHGGLQDHRMWAEHLPSLTKGRYLSPDRSMSERRLSAGSISKLRNDVLP